ncbi:PaaI family thioesterase [Yinghuangia soli]|uniref:PaaI family thioesterase n=1 Tax=Yinghuangia soli TaxID=2908204 RepID=A0AA41PXF3_9ACTN|nr:PaaI family thioesterase [Yinghuangia soli]MCF2527665.1 PaaI family thioesterase [Yinghuangia soli]
MGRTRTIEWEDPAATAATAASMAGLDFLRAMIAGTYPPPPIAETLGFTLDEVEHGYAVFSLVPGEEHYNPIGSVHGGVYATLLDSAAGCAVHTTLAHGVGYTSLDLNTKFLRPVTMDSGRIRAVGKVLSAGRRTALAEAQLLDERGKLLAHATSSCLIFPLPGA